MLRAQFFRRALLALAIPLVGLLAAGCSSSDSAGASTSPCASIAIDRFKELLVVDASITNDPRADSATDGEWSFRHYMEQLAGANDPSDFTMSWLTLYTSLTTIDGYPLQPRATGINSVVCPWLQATASNQCDATCATCAARKLDLAVAPFELMGFANRLDLREYEPGAPAGEGRVLFGLKPNSVVVGASIGAKQDMTVIFEYTLPTDGNRGQKYWAQQWHALGAYADFGDDYKNALATLVASYAQPGNLGQLRTNERVFDWDWSFRQFQMVNGKLQAVATTNSPDPSLNGSTQLSDFLQQNASAAVSGKAQISAAMLGGESLSLTKWGVPGVSEAVRAGFAGQTCGGCHSSERTADSNNVDINFQVSPYRQGTDRVSTFLNNPADNTKDELAHRTKEMQDSLCASN